MTTERDHIARAALGLDDPYAALNDHLHGQGKPTIADLLAVATDDEADAIRAAMARLEESRT